MFHRVAEHALRVAAGRASGWPRDAGRQVGAEGPAEVARWLAAVTKLHLT